MQLKLTAHLRNRLKLRNISEGLVKEIYEAAEERFFDVETLHQIAVKRVWFAGKERELMVAYTELQEEVLLYTVHPLKAGQKESRIRRGRWRKKP